MPYSHHVSPSDLTNAAGLVQLTFKVCVCVFFLHRRAVLPVVPTPLETYVASDATVFAPSAIQSAQWPATMKRFRPRGRLLEGAQNRYYAAKKSPWRGMGVSYMCARVRLFPSQMAKNAPSIDVEVGISAKNPAS